MLIKTETTAEQLESDRQYAKLKNFAMFIELHSTPTSIDDLFGSWVLLAQGPDDTMLFDADDNMNDVKQWLGY